MYKTYDLKASINMAQVSSLYILFNSIQYLPVYTHTIYLTYNTTYKSLPVVHHIYMCLYNGSVSAEAFLM